MFCSIVQVLNDVNKVIKLETGLTGDGGDRYAPDIPPGGPRELR